MRVVRSMAAAALALALAAVGLAPVAVASTSDQESTWAYAHAIYPSDGDTIWVCLEKNTSCTTRDDDTWSSIRLMSIQAMEVVHDGGINAEAKAAGVPSMTVDQCHGAEATAALNQLVFGSATWGSPKLSSYKLRLRSEKESSSSYGRERRTVEVYKNGKWVDVQAELLKQGQAMFMPLPSALGENAHNAEYSKLAQTAAVARVGLWDTDYCGSGPSQSANLVVEIKYDANGDDLTNVNGEWIRIRNAGTTSVNLKGWSLRTASWQVYDFTTSTTVAPGAIVYVHSGKKPSNPAAGHYYMGKSSPFLQNTEGGGAYLFDADGDMRSWSAYVCSVNCAKNPGLKISKVVADAKGIDANNLNGEYVAITNTTGATVSLAPVTLVVGGRTYVFVSTSKLKAYATVKIHMGKGTTTATDRYWRLTSPVLANGGGKAQLRSYGGTVLHSYSW